MLFTAPARTPLPALSEAPAKKGHGPESPHPQEASFFPPWAEELETQFRRLGLGLGQYGLEHPPPSTHLPTQPVAGKLK